MPNGTQLITLGLRSNVVTVSLHTVPQKYVLPIIPASRGELPGADAQTPQVRRWRGWGGKYNRLAWVVFAPHMLRTQIK